MTRCFHFLVWVVVGGLAFSSCTCQRDVPEPPKATERSSGGFQASLATRAPLKGEVVERLARITPVEPTVPEGEETPPKDDASLPENFPTDIPLFEGAETFAVQDLAQGAKNVLFYVDEEESKVFDFYKQGMDQEGWKVTQEAQQKYQSFLSFKKDKMVTNMTISKDPKTGRQIVAIMYYEEEDLPFPEF
jgi:hypothetical protein